MSSSRAKKVKMATKSCPDCDQQVPVACKSCPCGYIFISRKLLHAKRAEKSPPTAENRSEAKRRRTERVKREKINSAVNKDLENRKRSRSNSQSDHSRRGRGRPKTASAKKHEEERGGRKAKGGKTANPKQHGVLQPWGTSRVLGSLLWVPLADSMAFASEKQEKEVDMYANLSDEKAFVFSVALAEINRKIINQRLIL
uniref:Chromosome 16 open reading frame 87 n=1 Tax=Crocodylus porosus TaxID=8502 RepID=A0A7M4E8C8_CROPO